MNVISYNPDDRKEKVYLGKEGGKYILIDTGDLNFSARFNEVIKNIDAEFNEKRKEYGIENANDVNKVKNVDIDELDSAIDSIKKQDEFIRKQIDYLLGYKASPVIFGEASSLSINDNGDSLYELFLNALIPFVEKQFKTKVNRLSKKVEKYTASRGKYTGARRK